MNRTYLNAGRPLLMLGLVAALGAGLAACESPEQRRYANLSEDNSTCATFGAGQGSRDYTDCMLKQQSRRDSEKLNALERQRFCIRTYQGTSRGSRNTSRKRDPGRDRHRTLAGAGGA